MVAQRSLTMLFFCALLIKVCVHLLFRKKAAAQQSGRLAGGNNPSPTTLNKINCVYFSLCGDSKILVLVCFLVE